MNNTITRKTTEKEIKTICKKMSALLPEIIEDFNRIDFTTILITSDGDTRIMPYYGEYNRAQTIHYRENNLYYHTGNYSDTPDSQSLLQLCHACESIHNRYNHNLSRRLQITIGGGVAMFWNGFGNADKDFPIDSYTVFRTEA